MECIWRTKDTHWGVVSHLQNLQKLFFLGGFNGLEMLNLVSECLRGLFIIDEKGVLRQITMNDLPVGRSVDETLRLVQAFQYTDKHGEGTGNKSGMGWRCRVGICTNVCGCSFKSCSSTRCFVSCSVSSRMEARQWHGEYHPASLGGGHLLDCFHGFTLFLEEIYLSVPVLIPQIIPDPSGKLKYFDKLNWFCCDPWKAADQKNK